MQGFESVEHELEQKRLQLEQELESVRGRMSAIEADLERVHEALGALTGGPKKRTRNRSRAKKPLPTVAELQRHIAHVREASPFADAPELEKSVRALVRETGASLSGFKTLFAEALLTSPGAEPRSHHASGSVVAGHESHDPFGS